VFPVDCVCGGGTVPIVGVVVTFDATAFVGIACMGGSELTLGVVSFTTIAFSVGNAFFVGEISADDFELYIVITKAIDALKNINAIVVNAKYLGGLVLGLKVALLEVLLWVLRICSSGCFLVALNNSLLFSASFLQYLYL